MFYIVEKFGRYPQRNLLLGRESSQEELEFLQKSKHTFVRSVLPLKSGNSRPNGSKQAVKLASNENDKTMPNQRLLFLHGFRQSANKLSKRLSYIVSRLKKECNAHVTFLNGTHPYRPKGEMASQLVETLGQSVLAPIESQRVWFSSSDNAEIYEGIDESLAYVLTHVNIHGPYGIILEFLRHRFAWNR